MATRNLGSASIGVDLDLKQVQADAVRAGKIIGQIEDTANKQARSKSTKGGILSNLMDGAGDIGSSIPGLDRLTGSLGRITSAAGGAGQMLGGVGAAAGGAGAAGIAAMTGVGIAIAAVIALVGAAVLAIKGMQVAFGFAMDSLQAAADVQAAETAFKTLAANLGITSGQIASFRSELAALDYDSTEQVTIMNSLAQALGANGLSKQALDAAKAMRELSVAGGVSSKEGIVEMTQAVATLDTTILRDNGVVKTASQLYSEYATANKTTADAMSVTQKQQAILSGVIEAGAANTGTAAAAANDYNRLLTRIGSNSQALKATIGQIFLPLASGILSAINTEIVGLTGQLQNGENSFKMMGQTIANVVVPMFQQLIAWIKTLPWSQIIAGIYNTMQYMQAMGRIWSLVGSMVANGVSYFVGLFKIVAGAVGIVVGAFQTAAAVVSNFWKVLKGEQSVGDALINIGNAATTAFSSAFDKLGEGIQESSQAVQNYYKDIGAAFEGVGKDFSQMISASDVESWWNGMSENAKKSAQESLNDWVDTADGMSDAGMKAARKMAEQLAKENADFARNQAKALRDYEQQLAELVAGHRDAMADIQKDINKESKAYSKSYEKRTQEYQDELNKLNKADDDRKKDINTQIAEELSKGMYADQTKLASLRSRLNYESAAHQDAVKDANTNYQTDISNAKTAYDERIAELQLALNKELAIQAKHGADFAKYRDYQIADDITKLKANYVEQKAEQERAHAERVADIIRQGTEEAKNSGAAGTGVGKAYGGGVAGGLGSMQPIVGAEADKLGKNASDKAGAGFEGKKPALSTTFRDTLIGVANSVGGFIGGIFRPIGEGIIWIFNDLFKNGGQGIAQAMKDMFKNALGFLGNLSNFGKELVAKMGNGIANALGGIGGAFKDAWNGAGLPRFATGGIVQGKKGVDNVTARLTAGEMVLNKGQQQRMFSILNGQLDTSGATGGGGGTFIENLTVSLPGVRNASDFERDLSLKFRTLRTGA